MNEANRAPVSLSIAIVTYNSAHCIRTALNSIYQHLPENVPTALTVVDNHSTDGTFEQLKKYTQHSQIVTFIRNAKNRGFGKAHNQALFHTSSVYHVICNPDIRLSNDVFSPLIDYMNSSPRVGLACPRFLSQEGALQHLNRRHPTVLDLFLRRFSPERVRPLLKKRLRSYDMQDVGYAHSYEVPFMTGAFMFCRTDVLKAVGGFDERYFLYFEDADISRKVQQIGYQTVYYPDVTVTHAWERMAHKSWKGTWLFIESAYRYFSKWGFRWW